MIPHQYIERHTGQVFDETFFGEFWVAQLYGSVREHAPSFFNACVGPHLSAMLGWLQFDLPGKLTGATTICRMARKMGISLTECLAPPASFTSMRKLFERQISYCECRPMSHDPNAIASPADARVIVGSLDETDLFFIKEKFFSLAELFGEASESWCPSFKGGQFAIFRLTPDKYHYNHVPVSGQMEAPLCFEISVCPSKTASRQVRVDSTTAPA